MRWNIPQDLDKRFIKKFAFLPTVMSDGRTEVWLEYYWASQVYYEKDMINPRWRTIRKSETIRIRE